MKTYTTRRLEASLPNRKRIAKAFKLNGIFNLQKLNNSKHLIIIIMKTYTRILEANTPHRKKNTNGIQANRDIQH